MLIYIDSKLFNIISYHKHLYHDIYSYCLYHTSLAHVQTKLTQQTLGALLVMSSAAVPTNEPVQIHSYSQLYICGVYSMNNKFITCIVTHVA